MSNFKLNFNYEQLTKIASQRWLQTNEIFKILQNVEFSTLRNFAVNSLPHMPSFGSIFILNSKNLNKKWKHDGYNYLKRKNGVGIREDIEKLKVAGKNEIYCFYSYIIEENSTDQKKMLKRRIYKLIKNPEENENFYFLVHYFKEKEEKTTKNDGNLINFTINASPSTNMSIPET